MCMVQNSNAKRYPNQFLLCSRIKMYRCVKQVDKTTNQKIIVEFIRNNLLEIRLPLLYLNDKMNPILEYLEYWSI